MRNNGKSYFKDMSILGCGVFIGAFIYGLLSHGFSLLYIFATLILALIGPFIVYPINSYFHKKAEQLNK